MNFEDVLDQEKKELTEALIFFGEGKRVNKALVDLERNRPELYKFYTAGQQSKQAEIIALTRELELMKGWEKIAHTNGEDKRKYLSIISEVLNVIENEVIEVDYDEYRFVGNFVDADKLKEILNTQTLEENYND